MVQAQPFSTNACRGTQLTAEETVPVQFLQQEKPHQVPGWRVETTAIQIYAGWQRIVCNLLRSLLQDDSRWMGGSGGAAVHTRRTRHSFAFACTACCKNWFERSHSHTRRHRCRVALSLACQKDITCPIYQQCGTQNSTRFVEISKLAWSLGDSIRESLIGLHAFTGCDTVSAFASRRKLDALNPMKSDITYLETFSQVGQSWDVKPPIYEKVQHFTCRMYVTASSTILRWTTCVCAKWGEIESSLQPPFICCLFVHLLQEASWKCYLHARPTLNDPTKCGWIDDDGKLDRRALDAVATSTIYILSWNCWFASVSVPASWQSLRAWQKD